ncbi:hypothetical protein E1B28_010229 [Marasmius oreades]|uniref:Uncharacterized protein n=1 Tax=Marasmius oreades TaxID=181124 RepID=A0A9P7RXD6_9AGAR|nr:uncharacterized protein E1B28_010229 [Marasmius oreades]KAG7091177.1 hypothetical protein E1B28_010229 [Marasmius oreades]
MSYAGHNFDTFSQPMSSVGKYKQRLSYPISSLQSVTDTPCIRFSPEGAVSYTIVDNDQTGSDSCPPLLALGKRAFHKAKKWLQRPNTLQFPPVESTISQKRQTTTRRKFRWSLQTSSNLPRTSARPSLRVFRSRCDSSASESSVASSSSEASTSSQSNTSVEDSEDMPIANGRLSHTPPAFMNTLSFHPTTHHQTIDHTFGPFFKLL